jgi:hypothetical protein
MRGPKTDTVQTDLSVVRRDSQGAVISPSRRKSSSVYSNVTPRSFRKASSSYREGIPNTRRSCAPVTKGAVSFDCHIFQSLARRVEAFGNDLTGEFVWSNILWYSSRRWQGGDAANASGTCSGLQCFAVVLMCLGRIPPNAGPLKFNGLRPQRTPENPRRFFRNQQAVGHLCRYGGRQNRQLSWNHRLRGEDQPAEAEARAA